MDFSPVFVDRGDDDTNPTASTSTAESPHKHKPKYADEEIPGLMTAEEMRQFQYGRSDGHLNRSLYQQGHGRWQHRVSDYGSYVADQARRESGERDRGRSRGDWRGRGRGRGVSEAEMQRRLNEASDMEAEIRAAAFPTFDEQHS